MSSMSLKVSTFNRPSAERMLSDIGLAVGSP